MTVPSQEQIAKRLSDAGKGWWAPVEWIETLDFLADRGFPIRMGYDHRDCETCGGTGTWHNPSGLPAFSENGVLGWVDCPDGEPVYWEAP